MSISQAEGGTRSGLLWEVERILKELSREKHSLPQVLLMENVPEVVGAANLEDMIKWQNTLEELGYKNYVEILNSKDYGIPQNRRRCFMISVLGDYTYNFPIKLKREYKLKDLLQKVCPKKYYLTNEHIERISNWKAHQKPLENVINPTSGALSPTITARGAGEDHSGMILVNGEDKNMGRVQNSNRELSPTLDTRCDCLGVVVKDEVELVGGIGEKKSNGGRQYFEQNRIYNGENIATTIPAEKSFHPYYTENASGNNLKIRKLTPKECVRLMGFEDSDYEAMRSIGMTDANIYHMAGDSIVVTVLMSIFSPLIYENDEHKQIVKEYIKKGIIEK